MLWKKPAGLKYTELCMYIDENIPNIVNPGEHPDIENKVYNYLWLVVKALAIKKCMFSNFSDYDAYSFFAANRLYFAIRKNYWNTGKVIKGKEIRPIKSCLNYTKALLYPIKVEFQRETFRGIISEDYTSKKFDSFSFREKLRSEARAAQGIDKLFKEFLESSFVNIGKIIDDVLKSSPFAPATSDFKRLKISLLLNALHSLKVKHKLDSETQTIILWKLPKSMSNYMRILLKEFYTALKTEIIECYAESDMEDSVVDSILADNAAEVISSEE